MTKSKSNPKRKEKASSMSVQKIAVLATIVSALVGGLSGYFGSRLQTDTLRSIKKDDIARSLTEADLEQMARLGISSDYSPIAHYAVHRRILEDFDVSKQVSLEEVRDKVENAIQVCRHNRVLITQLLIAQKDRQRLKETVQSMRDDIEKYCAYIDSIPNTPEASEYKNILRKYAESEKRRLDILEAMCNKEGLNKARDLIWEAIQKEGEERAPLLEAIKKVIEEDGGLQFR